MAVTLLHMAQDPCSRCGAHTTAHTALLQQSRPLQGCAAWGVQKAAHGSTHFAFNMA